MGEQVKTSRWQEWRLRLRALQGWGCDVPELRQWARFYALGVRILPIFIAVELALSLVIFAILPRMGIGAAQPEPVSFVVRLSLPLLVIALLLMVVFGYLNVRHSVRAEAGAHQPLATHSGSCFATVLASPQLFALIGMTRDQARWFCLPIDWDTTVEPGSDRFELTVNPATGYVARLRRIGAEPRELRQGVEAATDEGEAAATDVADGEATAAQRRELLRTVHRENSAWGAYSGAMLNYSLSLVVGGLILVIAGIVIAVVFTRTPSKLSQADNTRLLLFIGLIFGLLALTAFVLAVMALRAWRRQSHAEATPSVTIEGSQVCWMPFHDFYGARDESLALVRLDDDDNLIFRIPGQWAHRVRRPNTRVRVTYNEQTWLVLDYRAVDATHRTSA